MIKPLITAKRAREVLIYDKAKGEFRWRITRTNRVQAGRVAGHICPIHGYRTISIDGRKYYAARLAFLMVKGRWPNPEIDHRDNDRANDRWANLREATKSQQSMNRPARRDSVNGLKGVALRTDGKYQAQIHAHLGVFRTAMAAHLAWRRAAKILHGEFYNAKRRPGAKGARL